MVGEFLRFRGGPSVGSGVKFPRPEFVTAVPAPAVDSMIVHCCHAAAVPTVGCTAGITANLPGLGDSADASVPVPMW